MRQREADVILFRGAGRCEQSTPPHRGGVAAADRPPAIPDGARIAMRKTLLTTTLAALCTLPAAAADRPADGSLRIESEAQFARDYGDLVERAGPGVYQIVKGPLAGKTIAMGEAGLAYDLAGLRARTANSLRERMWIKARIKHLEQVGARFATLRTLPARGIAKVSSFGTLPCVYHNPRTNIATFYLGSTYVNATAQYYLDNGGGGLNPYYARAAAAASGVVSPPYGVPYGSGVMSAFALAWNHNSGALVQRFGYGPNASAATGFVYSGPDFSHNLEASASVEGEGDCYGYVSISDTLR